MYLNKIYKRLGYVAAFGCGSLFLNAQTPLPVKPDPAIKKAPAAEMQPVPLPAAYNGIIKLNYVRIKEAIAPIGDLSGFKQAGYQQVKQTTDYLDGLGRPLQTVNRELTPGTSPSDLVTFHTYDDFGREVYQYLPYAQTNGSDKNDGRFKLNPFGDQQNFYTTLYKDANGKPMYEGEEFFYSKKDYEPSVLDRVNKSMGPGNSWVGSNRGIQQQYLVNTANDSVRIWHINNDPFGFINEDITTNIPVTSTTYAPGQLYENLTTDEDGNAVIEFKDKEGQLILKKVQIGDVSGTHRGHANWLCTYYVYDDLNRLRFVMPPKAVEAIKHTWSLQTPSADIIKELCFRYEYDHRDRMIGKKAPGSGWVYMLYDQRDRLVFSQDGNQRAKAQWMATLYDGLNRPVITGILNCGLDARVLQHQLDGSCLSCGKIFIPRQLPLLPDNIIITDGESNGAPFWPVIMNPIPRGYTFIPLKVNYYDDYSWTNKKYTDSYNTKLDAGDNLYPEDVPSFIDQQNASTRGMLTGHRVRVLGDPDKLQDAKWLTTVIYYDEKGRVVQTQADNYKGGTDILVNRYDFTGKIISNYLAHSNPQGTPQTVKVKTTMEYDHAGRLLEIWKTINDEDGKKTLIASNHYDELGQLKTKKLGATANEGVSTGLSLETLDYNYNIRGWLKGINTAYSHPELLGDVDPDRWFGMELNYDGGNTPQSKCLYNGNISSIQWRTKGDGIRRAYGFSYDMAGRLLGGDFSEYNGNGYTDNSAINFDMVMGDGSTTASAYDENGNIKSMKHWAWRLHGSVPIDQLAYSYYANSNKLRAVAEDPSTALDNNLGDFTDNHKGTDDYGYDLNGNLITDLNKRIEGPTGIDQVSRGAIEYNHLNLPWKITIKDQNSNIKGTITYTYDAAGNKLEKKVQDNTNATVPVKTTSYIGSLLYEQNILQFITHEEGRIRYEKATESTCPAQPDRFVYDYFIKDHLGNVRLVLTDEQQSDCYIAASMEANQVEEEKRIYDIKNEQVEELGEQVKNMFPSLQNRAYRVRNAQEENTGLGIVLKVMSGDQIRFRVESYYTPPVAGTTAGNSVPVILSQLLGAFVNAAAISGNKPSINAADIISKTEIAGPLESYLKDPARVTPSSVPRT